MPLFRPVFFPPNPVWNRTWNPSPQPKQQPSGRLQKARLLLSPNEAARLGVRGAASGNAGSIVFQYNPTELKFDHSLETKAEGRTYTGLRKTSFAGPNPTKLTISNITFDTFEQGISVKTRYIDPLLKSMRLSSGIPTGYMMRTPVRRPPIYTFCWGQNRYLRCFVKQIDYKYTLFLPNGTPVRAVANLSLEEATQFVKAKK
ncbi:hypothetical protein LEP3755_12230 [Leptolyngbya sp. NIES-3755]|nr:hypothetical protein LEP3755_12230 [Leptolyngbya sp. NIES-3755]